MEFTNTLNNINNQLQSFIADDEYTSIGFVPILNSITPADIIAIKKAQKLLDIIIVQNIGFDNFDELTIDSLKKLNINLAIDALIEEAEPNFHLSLETNINANNLMRGILAILPSSIFVSNDNFEVCKSVVTINSQFKNLFTLHNIQSPESIKSFAEIAIIKQLQNLDKSNLTINKQTIFNYLESYTILDYKDFTVNNSLFVNLTIKSENIKLNISYEFTK